MPLRFARPRRIEAEPAGRWLEGVALSVDERAQLVHIVQGFVPALDEEAILGAVAATLARANGIAECPVEWWDVVDDADVTRFQLWLYAADCGVLFHAGTTERAGPISACAFYGDGWDTGAPGSLAVALDEAQARVSVSDRDTELAHVAFVNRE